MTQETAPNQETPALPFRKHFERAAGRMGIRLVVGPVRAMPLPMARAFGKGLGELLFRALGRYRRVALKNLALIYADKGPEERQRMARAVFRHFGEMAVEFIKMPQLSREDVDRMVTVEGEENLCRAFEAGKGVLLITGHFGNWEFMARWLTMHGYPLNVVARDARDPAATKLMADTRQGNGAQVLYRGNSARGILQALKKNQIVALLPDQNAADLFVPFLGQPTGTVDGPGVLHLRTGAPLLFSWCRRTPDDRFHITFEPPEVVAPTGAQAADVARVMALINARLEAQIRQTPTQWLWLHDRWKASPGVFPDGAEQARLLNTPLNKYRQEMRERHDSADR
jgi:KDO2-lipid IV(A) lauroyltransferase